MGTLPFSASGYASVADFEAAVLSKPVTCQEAAWDKISEDQGRTCSTILEAALAGSSTKMRKTTCARLSSTSILHSPSWIQVQIQSGLWVPM